MLCVAILGSDVGQNRSENVGDHKLASDLAKNRSENSLTRLKTGRGFSFSDLSPTINAQPAKREFLFQCTSVAIARGNTMILNTLRQSWQQQPSANTKRGKPHRATLKAGLWDEPLQLARALATGF